MRALANRPYVMLGLVFAGALAIRLLALYLAEPTSLAGDELDYFRRAVMLARGEPHADPAGRAPGAIALYAAVFELFHPWGQLAKAANALCGALLVFPVHGLARAYAGDRAALLAAALAALYPDFIGFSIALWSEPVFMLLASSAMLAVVWALDTDRSPVAVAWLALAGALFGFAALCRESGVVLPVVVAGYWLFVKRRGTGAPSRWEPAGRSHAALASMGGAGALLLAFVVVIAPRVAFVNQADAPFALVTRTSYMNLYVGNSPHGEGTAMRHYPELGPDRVSAEVRAREIALADIRARLPWWPFEKIARQVPRFFKPGSFPVRRLLTPPGDPGRWGYAFRWSWLESPVVRGLGVLWIVACYVAVLTIGAAGLVLARRTELSWLFALFVLAQLAPSIVTFSMSRFRLPSMVFFVVGAAALVAGGGRDWSVASSARRRGAVALSGLLLFLVALGYESALVATEG